MGSRGEASTGSRGGVAPTFQPGTDAQAGGPKALHDAEPTKLLHSLLPPRKGFGDRDREFALSYKNRLFYKLEPFAKKQTAHFSYIKRSFNVIRLNYRFACQCTNYMISIDLKAKKGYT